MGETALAVVLVLATSVWVGGLVTLAVVARAASRTVGAADRVAFFRSLGRSYGAVGGLAMVAALAAGAALVAGRPWSGLLATTGAVAVTLVLSTVAGVVQAREMTRLRQRAVSEPSTPRLRAQLRQGSVAATALRGLIAASSIALVVLGVLVAG